MRAAGGERNTLQASLGSSCSLRELHVGSVLDTGNKEGFFTQNQFRSALRDPEKLSRKRRGAETFR